MPIITIRCPCNRFVDFYFPVESRGRAWFQHQSCRYCSRYLTVDVRPAAGEPATMMLVGGTPGGESSGSEARYATNEELHTAAARQMALHRQSLDALSQKGEATKTEKEKFVESWEIFWGQVAQLRALGGGWTQPKPESDFYWIGFIPPERSGRGE